MQTKATTSKPRIKISSASGTIGTIPLVNSARSTSGTKTTQPSSCGRLVLAAATTIGGRFPTAGGWQYSSYLSCFRWTEGWSGVNGVFASDQITTAFSWNGTYQLLISVNGNTPYVYGPTSQGGASGYVYANGLNPIKGNEWHNSFPNFWFSQ